LSDQIAVMKDGRIIQMGSPWEIYYKPANTFVADFVGTANLLQAEVVEKKAGRLTVSINGSRIGITEKIEEPEIGTRITVCIRPETIRVSRESEADRPNTLEGRVVNSIFEGAQIRYWIAVGDQEIVVDVFDPSATGLLEGNVLLYFPPEKMHIIADV